MTPASALVDSLGADVAAVGDRVRRSTVQVADRRGAAAGSGVVWDATGLIITNAHVTRGAHAVVRLDDGRTLEAVVRARDDRRDLVALSIDARDLPAAIVGDAAALRTGELVLAIGHPYGVVNSLALGIVHGPPAPLGRRGARWLRADVGLAPGNSGGPLADTAGRVVGINSMIARGLALAVPADAVARFVVGGGARSELGVTLRPTLVRQRTGAALGLLVVDVADRGAAADAGVERGDVVLAIDGSALAGPDDLADAVDDVGSALPLRLTIARAGRRRDHIVTARPASPRSAAA